MARIIVVSDSHLSFRAPYADESWDAVLTHVDEQQPELVVHAGDISLNGVVAPGELDYARRRLDELSVPWRAVPGNHDIGDVPGGPDPIGEDTRRRYDATFGDGSWIASVGRWNVVGIDIQTLCSPLPESEAVWSLLTGAMDPDRPTVLVLHRPLGPLEVGEVDRPERFVPPPFRRRLDDVLDTGDVRAVVNGHVHQWRTGSLGGRLHVWAPTCWAVLPERIQATVGVKVCGVLGLDLGDDGEVEAHLVRPAGVGQWTNGDDFPSPFDI